MIYPAGKSKYRNVRTEADGLKFASKKEAKRWVDLQLLQNAGRVKMLQRQVPIDCEVNGIIVCRYVCDFSFEEYRHRKWISVWEDAKGYQTPIYRLKKKLMLACHGIEIRET